MILVIITDDICHVLFKFTKWCDYIKNILFESSNNQEDNILFYNDSQFIFFWVILWITDRFMKDN